MEDLFDLRSIESGRYTEDEPVPESLDLKWLRKSEDPQERSIAEIAIGLANLRREVSEIRSILEPKTTYLADMLELEQHYLNMSNSGACESNRPPTNSKNPSWEDDILEYYEIEHGKN